MKTLNLDKLKEEISNSKQQNNQAVQPKDLFLHGIMEAWKTGRPNQATNIIKNVDYKTEIKQSQKGGPVLGSDKTLNPDIMQHVINESENSTSFNNINEVNTAQQNNNLKLSVNKLNENVDRDELLDAEQDRRIREYKKIYQNYPGLPNAWLPPENKNLNENNASYKNNMQESMPTMINEEVINGIEQRIFNNINENLVFELKDVLKNTIIELYTIDKIKNTLLENTEITKKIINDNKQIIKQIIIETIKELQNKSKK